MDARIMETYAVLVPESDMKMLKGYKEHFEDLKRKTGYLKELEIECYQMVLDRITELQNEKQENPLPA